MSLVGGSLRSLRLIGLFSAISLVGQTPQPPVAPVIEHRETRYGTTVVDNYFWLREKSNPEVIKYLEKENAYTEAMTKPLKPFEDALYSEMLSHIKQTDLSVPVRRGDYLLLFAHRGRQAVPDPVPQERQPGGEGRSAA